VQADGSDNVVVTSFDSNEDTDGAVQCRMGVGHALTALHVLTTET